MAQGSRRPQRTTAECGIDLVGCTKVQMRTLFLSALLLIWQVAAAEAVPVKHHGIVNLEAFTCSDVKERSDVSRICYDRAERYMVIRLKTTYYHYCEIDSVTVEGLRNARSKREFFETSIRGSGSDGPFDCRTRPVPKKYRQ